MTDPLVAVRDVHYGSSIIVAGIVFFDLLIASPTLRWTRLPATVAAFRARTAALLWICLALSIISGFGWLCLLAAGIVDKPVADVIADGTVWLVLLQTQFGFAWKVRFLFGVVLVACLVMRRTKDSASPVWQEVWAALLAAAYLGTMAFAGHGEEGLGLGRNLHLAVDFLHLIAAGLWLGGLVPLALLLFYLRLFREEAWVSVACNAAARFSDLGIVAVGTLLISGVINAYFLVGDVDRLVGTGYGRLLLLKITLFAAMVCLAGINREYLLPRLSHDSGVDRGSRTLQWLVGSALAEIFLGIGIVVVVGMLGIMAPATDMHAHVH